MTNYDDYADSLFSSETLAYTSSTKLQEISFWDELKILATYDGPLGNEAEFLMIQIFVRYLLMDGLLHSGQDIVRNLLDYSVQNWSDHIRNILLHENELTHTVLQLYDTDAVIIG